MFSHGAKYRAAVEGTSSLVRRPTTMKEGEPMGSLMGSLSRILFGDQRDPRRVLAEQFNVPMPDSGSPPGEAVDWARSALDEAQIDESQYPVRAIRVLRQKKKRLGLPTTKYLVDHLRYHR